MIDSYMKLATATATPPTPAMVVPAFGTQVDNRPATARPVLRMASSGAGPVHEEVSVICQKPAESAIMIRSESVPSRPVVRRKTVPANGVASARPILSMSANTLPQASKATSSSTAVVHVPRRSLQGVTAAATPPFPFPHESRVSLIGGEVCGSSAATNAAEVVEAFATPAASTVPHTPSEIGSEAFHSRDAFAHLSSTICICGARFPDDALFCRRCGRRRPQPAMATVSSSPTSTSTLAAAAAPAIPRVHMPSSPAPPLIAASPPLSNDSHEKIAAAVEAAVADALGSKVPMLIEAAIEVAEGRIREFVTVELALKESSLQRLQGDASQMQERLAEVEVQLEQVQEALAKSRSQIDTLAQDVEACRVHSQSAVAEAVSHRETEMALVELRARYETTSKDNGNALQIGQADHEALEVKVGTLSENIDMVSGSIQAVSQRISSLEESLRSEIATDRISREADRKDGMTRIEALSSELSAAEGRRQAMNAELLQVESTCRDSVDRVEAVKYVLEQEALERRALEASLSQRLREAEEALSAEVGSRSCSEEALRGNVANFESILRMEIDALRADWISSSSAREEKRALETSEAARLVPEDAWLRFQEAEVRFSTRLEQQQRSLELVLERERSLPDRADMTHQLELESRARASLAEDLELVVKSQHGKLQALVNDLADGTKVALEQVRGDWRDSLELECARHSAREEEALAQVRSNSKAIQALRDSVADVSQRQQESAAALSRQLMDACRRLEQELSMRNSAVTDLMQASAAQGSGNWQAIQADCEDRLAFLESFLTDAGHLFCDKLKGRAWQKCTRSARPSQMQPLTAR
mmetsp:Transcript_33035/g.77235  ORF Transcript_33035/g.77235 Transcript_33035/m.77235 type:complete len:826 (+) Transcript_33035:55-2532(+)